MKGNIGHTENALIFKRLDVIVADDFSALMDSLNQVEIPLSGTFSIPT